MLAQVVVELLAERLRVVQQLQSGEVNRHLRRTLFPRLGGQLGQLLNLALAFPASLVDAGTVLCALEVSPGIRHRVLVLTVDLTVGIRLRSEEEVQRGRLHLGVGVETRERGNRDGLGVGPACQLGTFMQAG